MGKTAHIRPVHSRTVCDTYISTIGGGRGAGGADPSVRGERRLLPTSEAARAPAALILLAERVRRLSPSHRDPERFHEDKSEIERELRRLARRVASA